jgi:hypothetical protein
MRWFHVIETGEIEGFTDSARAKVLPEPPKGIKFVEVTAEMMAEYNALVEAKAAQEETKPIDRRDDTRVKVDADTAVFEVLSGRA